MAEIEKEEYIQAERETRKPAIVRMYLQMGPDHRHCNAPHHEEVAVVFTGENGEPPQHRDIIVYPKDQPSRHISYMSANCDPMVYPLIFPMVNQVGIMN